MSLFCPPELNFSTTFDEDSVESRGLLNPLIPEHDKHLISPNNITSESHIEVMRIKEMITNLSRSWLLNKFCFSAP